MFTDAPTAQGESAAQGESTAEGGVNCRRGGNCRSEVVSSLKNTSDELIAAGINVYVIGVGLNSNCEDNLKVSTN